MDDKELLRLYMERSEAAIKITEEKYSALCKTISMNILGNEADAEECFNDTLLALWSTVPEKIPDNLRAYICSLARNISLKKYEFNSAKKRCSNYTRALDELSECLSDGHSCEGRVEEKELYSAINSFVSGLPKDKQTMFLRRYWFLDPVKEIAADLGISERNASMRLKRIRDKLKKYLIEEGYMYE